MSNERGRELKAELKSIEKPNIINKQQWHLANRMNNETMNMAEVLRDQPRDFERFNTGCVELTSPDAHICLPGGCESRR